LRELQARQFAAAACCCNGLRRSGDMGLSLGDTKASELLNDPNRKSMESKVRFGDFAQRTRENVEIVADAFNKLSVTTKTRSKPNVQQPHFPGGSGQHLSVNLGPSFALIQSEAS